MARLTAQHRHAVARALEAVISIEETPEDIIQAIAEELLPEDVFDVDQLQCWAENDSYKEDDE